LGNFHALEVGHPEIENDGKRRVYDDLKEIQSVADRIGARLVLVMVPAPVQACEPAELAYYPGNVNLADTARFDLDLPQRMMTDIARSLDLPIYDLRQPLRENSGECIYQPHNMHWTEAGHQMVADYITSTLTMDGYLP
jgi:hypothetical protein